MLQLLLIETTNELLHNDDVYNTIPPDQLLHLMKVLDHSYQFARSFNADKELRTGLWKVGAYSRALGHIRSPLTSRLRLHETLAESSEAGVEQRSHSSQCFVEDVL